jgi:hypothetical protein
MTDTVRVAIIASAGPTLVGMLNVLHQMMVARKMVLIGDGVQRVERQTDGIKDQLVAATSKVAHAEGVKDEKLRASLAQNEESSTRQTSRCAECPPGNPPATCPIPEVERPDTCPLLKANLKASNESKVG